MRGTRCDGRIGSNCSKTSPIYLNSMLSCNFSYMLFCMSGVPVSWWQQISLPAPTWTLMKAIWRHWRKFRPDRMGLTILWWLTYICKQGEFVISTLWWYWLVYHSNTSAPSTGALSGAIDFQELEEWAPSVLLTDDVPVPSTVNISFGDLNAVTDTWKGCLYPDTHGWIIEAHIGLFYLFDNLQLMVAYTYC